MIAALDAKEQHLSVNLPDFSEAFRTLSVPGTYRTLKHIAPEDRGRLSPTVRQYIDPAEKFNIEALEAAYEARYQLVGKLAEVFEKVDLILTPTTQTAPFPAEGPMPTEIDGHAVSHQSSIGVTFPFNLSGNPAISVPAGNVDGLPVGLQIVGRRHEDLRVLAAAAVLERAQPWPQLAPLADGAARTGVD